MLFIRATDKQCIHIKVSLADWNTGRIQEPIQTVVELQKIKLF